MMSDYDDEPAALGFVMFLAGELRERRLREAKENGNRARLDTAVASLRNLTQRNLSTLRTESAGVKSSILTNSSWSRGSR